MKNFTPITAPYMHGVSALRADGITVEVVQCFVGGWDVFLTRQGDVVAMSIDAFRSWGHGYTHWHNAMRIARSLVDSR